MSDPRKPIDNGRSWKAEFLPGSPGEKAIESLGLRPDHLRHDLVAFDEQIESLATISPYATGASIKDTVNEALVKIFEALLFLGLCYTPKRTH
mgnify:CR=1 FL=1